MNNRKYILEDRRPVVCESLMGWAAWLERENLAVACDIVGHTEVSTIFLGADYGYGAGDGPPLLFESMIIGGALTGKVERYATWEDAELGHRAMVERVLALHDAPTQPGEGA